MGTVDDYSSSIESLDIESVDDGHEVESPSFPVHDIVMEEEEQYAMKVNMRLLILLVHTVFIDNGFVTSDPFQHLWISSSTSKPFTVTYCVSSHSHSPSQTACTVDLRFQILRNFMCIYGSLSQKGSQIIRLLIDGNKNQPELENLRDENELIELRNTIKDKLWFPLRIEICRRGRLPLPPCFAQMPIDIKNNILELLSGTDLLKIACVSSEMRLLSSNDEMWRKKCDEEFDVVAMGAASMVRRWKDKYRTAMRIKKMRDRLISRREMFIHRRRQPIRQRMLP